jgi:hypothetical protein
VSTVPCGRCGPRFSRGFVPLSLGFAMRYEYDCAGIRILRDWRLSCHTAHVRTRHEVTTEEARSAVFTGLGWNTPSPSWMPLRNASSCPGASERPFRSNVGPPASTPARDPSSQARAGPAPSPAALCTSTAAAPPTARLWIVDEVMHQVKTCRARRPEYRQGVRVAHHPGARLMQSGVAGAYRVQEIQLKHMLDYSVCVWRPKRIPHW